MASNESNTQQEQPGLIAGHAEYIKGAAEVRFVPSFITITSSLLQG